MLSLQHIATMFGLSLEVGWEDDIQQMRLQFQNSRFQRGRSSKNSWSFLSDFFWTILGFCIYLGVPSITSPLLGFVHEHTRTHWCWHSHTSLCSAFSLNIFTTGKLQTVSPSLSLFLEIKRMRRTGLSRKPKDKFVSFEHFVNHTLWFFLIFPKV